MEDTQSAADANSDGDRRPVEEWAAEAGMLPEYLPTKRRLFNREIASVAQNPKFVQYRMALAHRGWPIGAEVTKAEFEKAVKEAGAIEAR